MKAMSVRAPRNGVKATPSADHSTRQRFDRAVRQLTTSRTSVVSGQQWAPLGWRRESPRVTGPTEEVSLNMTTVGCLQVRELAKRFDRCRTLLEHGHEKALPVERKGPLPWVETRGIEPRTSCLQSRRSTN